MSFFYNISVTGDCTNNNLGSFSIDFASGNTPYIVNWLTPLYASASTTGYYSLTGLSAGTYQFYVNDSSVPINQSSGVIQVYITSASTLFIQNVQNTSCGLSNGSLSVNTYTNYGTNDITLFKDSIEYTAVTVTTANQYTFLNLPEGVYYATCTNYGGCYGESENVVLYNTSPMDFGFYVVNNPACSLTNGKLYVTGVTGIPPYTYTWSSNISGSPTTSSVTGLTAGNYFCTVTDSQGCSITKTTTVANASPIGLITYTLVSPTCTGNTGSITYYISGGTGPYFYLLSNGDSLVSYDQFVTFSGLSAANYTLEVTDVALCTGTFNVVLQTPNTFFVVSESITDSSCNNNSGVYSIQLQGGTTPYTYNFTNNSGYTLINSVNIPNQTFGNLPSGDYTVTINDAASACTYTKNFSINTSLSFGVSITSTTTNCLSNGGSIYLEVTPVVTGLTYTYSLSNGVTSIKTNSTAYTFSNLSADVYDLIITDSNYCSQTYPVNILATNPINVLLYGTNCGNGSGGTISAMINYTDTPVDLTWSSNVNGQTGVYLTGLTAGTYTLSVSAETGCMTTKSKTITCNPLINFSRTQPVKVSKPTYIPAKTLDFKNMLFTGYANLVKGHEDCKLKYALFYCDIEITGTTYSAMFYTSNNLNLIPSLTNFTTAIDSLLSTIPNLDNIVINDDNNSIVVESSVVGGVEVYKDELLTISVRVVYNISCRT
jgi:hypothetical protein